MGEQLNKQSRRQEEEEVVDQEVTNTENTEQKEKLDDDVDAILDEIDDVLEHNAEDFVRAYIQKGGQ